MKLQIINEPIVLVRDLYDGIKISHLYTFPEWCANFLRAGESREFILLKDAINLLNTHFKPEYDAGIADWIEKNTDFGITKEDAKLQKALEYIKELERKNIALRNSNAQLSHELAMLQSLYCKKDIAIEEYKSQVMATVISNENHK